MIATATTMSAPDSLRGNLADRQHEVLSSLLAGRVPAGFEPRTATATARILGTKRWRGVLAADPELVEIPQARSLFERYAAVHPQPECSHHDGEAFVRWATLNASLPARLAAAQHFAVQQVFAGRRRVATTRRHGRRVLFVGLADSVFELKWRW